MQIFSYTLFVIKSTPKEEKKSVFQCRNLNVHILIFYYRKFFGIKRPFKKKKKNE